MNSNEKHSFVTESTIVSLFEKHHSFGVGPEYVLYILIALNAVIGYSKPLHFMYF